MLDREMRIKEKAYSIKAARRRTLNVLNYTDTLGHIAILTLRGEHRYVMMSIATYDRLQQYCTALSYAVGLENVAMYERQPKYNYDQQTDKEKSD